MIDKNKDIVTPPEKVAVTLVGTVQKVIPSLGPDEAEKVEIAVEGADALYREIRIENTLHDEAGNAVSLKKGVDVELTVEAENESTTAKKH